MKNDTYRNKKHINSLASACEIRDRAQENKTLRSRNGNAVFRFYRVQTLLISLGLALSLYGCGEDSGTQSNQSGASPTTGQARPDPKEVASKAQVSCKNSPLVNQWRQYSPSEDVITVGEDCLFETYACGSLGYINSDVSTAIGVADVVIVYQANNGRGCLGTGTFKCAYDARNSSAKQITVNCH